MVILAHSLQKLPCLPTQLSEFRRSWPLNEAPPYAILSHTWGIEEVTLKDLEAGDWKDRQDKREGHEKITGCCAAAAAEGFGYAWIDTCCIDKTSSAELSEAINSMFRWYHESAICYAYLRDVDSAQDPNSPDSDFSKSRWFTRGWTLQELLAPTEIVFLGRDWGEIGTKNTLQGAITKITRISSAALEDRSFTNYSVAQKMSWAAGRCTTRPEDEAYCLLGLFDVNMPLLYGEGQGARS
ncbi:heterokaryon incompatibility protein-domain-containing protein [Thelonectria olida]|uniref:Heterokaryon incompatibility protein-domain-containing protein n=1 Tax=Thelonectria olida TaxID=1576542 RepID=A0A9P8WJW6_9HYPO|nr:heterokaryon incompatibility protein-domain-containing protein [Thelonectria olida]